MCRCLQAGSWDCLKTMEGHKGSVNSVAVHPNGTVALSVGRCTLVVEASSAANRRALADCMLARVCT